MRRRGTVLITVVGNFPFRKSKIIEVIAERVKKSHIYCVTVHEM